MCHIVLLGAHRWSRESVPGYVEQAGLTPIVILNEGEPVDIPVRRFNHIIVPRNSSDDIEFMVSEIRARVGDEWYVLGLDDYVCRTAAELSYHSRLPSVAPSGPAMTLSKHVLRNLWNRYCKGRPRLTSVPFEYVQYCDLDLADESRRYRSPGFDESAFSILKPDALDASIGVRRMEYSDYAETRACLAAELQELQLEILDLGIAISPAVIIENEIPRNTALNDSAEFSAEFLTLPSVDRRTGAHFLLGVTEKLLAASSFVEVGHVFPSSSFPEDLLPFVTATVGHFLDHFNMRYGITHWEFIVTPDEGLALVEAQLRPAGDRIMEVICQATGTNPYVTLLDAIAGRKSTVLTTAEAVAAIFFPGPESSLKGAKDLTCCHPLEAEFGRTVFINENELRNADGWSGPDSCFTKHVGVITSGVDFIGARDACVKRLEDFRVVGHDSNNNSMESKLRLWC